VAQDSREPPGGLCLLDLFAGCHSLLFTYVGIFPPLWAAWSSISSFSLSSHLLLLISTMKTLSFADREGISQPVGLEFEIPDFQGEMTQQKKRGGLKIQ
jgi:hypothetical protein